MFWHNKTMSPTVFDNIKTYLPKYLSNSAQEKLWSELRSFPANLDQRFYTTQRQNEACLFQGDTVDNVFMPYCQKPTGLKTKSLLISNSCDVSRENKRLYKPYLLFAPIFDLQKWEALLSNSCKAQQKVQDHIQAIRQQRVSTFFFLPQTGLMKADCFARLDCVFSLMASDEHLQQAIRNRISTLSDYGFYMLLLKLSMHFTRVQESVARHPSDVPHARQGRLKRSLLRFF